MYVYKLYRYITGYIAGNCNKKNIYVYEKDTSCGD